MTTDPTPKTPAAGPSLKLDKLDLLVYALHEKDRAKHWAQVIASLSIVGWLLVAGFSMSVLAGWWDAPPAPCKPVPRIAEAARPDRLPEHPVVTSSGRVVFERHDLRRCLVYVSHPQPHTEIREGEQCP